MVIPGPVVGPACGHADADHGIDREAFPVGLGVEEMLEQFAVQVTEVAGHSELRGALVDCRQSNTEVEVADVGGEVVPDDPPGIVRR